MLRPPKKNVLARHHRLAYLNEHGPRVTQRVNGHSQERNPLEVLNHRIEEIAMAEPVLKESIPKVSDAGEYDRTCKEDFEAVQVESVDLWCQTQEEVVENATQDRGRDTICREGKVERK